MSPRAGRADVALLPRGPGHDRLGATIGDCAAQALRAGAEPDAVLPLLRAAAAAGADMPALLATPPFSSFASEPNRSAYDKEVRSGLR